MRVCNVVNHPRDRWFERHFWNPCGENEREKYRKQDCFSAIIYSPLYDPVELYSVEHKSRYLEWHFYVVFESILKLESFSAITSTVLFCKCMHKPPKRILLLCFTEERQSCKTAEWTMSLKPLTSFSFCSAHSLSLRVLSAAFTSCFSPREQLPRSSASHELWE